MNFYSIIFKHSGDLMYDVVEFEDDGVVVIYCPTRKDIKRYDNIDILKCVISEWAEDVELIKEGVIEDYSDSKDLLYSA